MCAILYFFLIVCNKPHAKPTIIYENIKETHILAVGDIPGISNFKSPPCFTSMQYPVQAKICQVSYETVSKECLTKIVGICRRIYHFGEILAFEMHV